MLRSMLVLVLATCPTAALAADEFPYTATITTDNVNVRSGPGVNYYATQYLNRGETVEVWRHDPGGWFAIRPPQHSYCWISSEFLELSGDGYARVTGDRVLCRVGSAFGDDRDVIQVRLSEGEEVELIESHPTSGATGGQAWYKIAPPAGEFRWVSGAYVARQLDAQSPTLAAAPTTEPGASMLDGIARAREATQELADSLDSIESGDVAAGSSPHVRLSQGLLSDHLDAPPAPEASASFSEREAPEVIDGVPVPRVTVALATPPGVETSLGQLEVELSRIVAESPDSWSFTELRRQVDTALAQAESAEERDYARQLHDKIDRYDNLRGRFAEAMRIRDETDAQNDALLATLDESPTIAEPAPNVTQWTAASAAAPAVAEASGRYDGTGRLSPVASREVGDPRFALLDSTGEVAAYVTPAPGVNLQPYVGLEVGISGTRGYLTRQQAPHLTARQVDRLGATVR